MIYSKIIRPLLFKIDPETIHTLVAGGGELVARVPILSKLLRSYFRVSPANLSVHAFGVDLPHPIGLSAGFDKDAKYVHFTEQFGFAFEEIGSITGKPYKGNEKPRLRRLLKNQSLVVNYGLKGEGADRVYKRMSGLRTQFPFGISMAKTNSPTCVGQTAIEDYAYVYKTFRNLGVYDTLNLSCPNTKDGTPFSDPQALEELLKKIVMLRKELNVQKKLFIKIGPDIRGEHLDTILRLIDLYKVDGIIISNLFKDLSRAHTFLPYPEEHSLSWKGGISGMAVQQASLQLIKEVYKKTNGKLFIIGCGGIYSAEDAYAKIRAGASLLQLITGFIYGGPSTIRTIVLGLSALLKRDGFATLDEVRGKDVL